MLLRRVPAGIVESPDRKVQTTMSAVVHLADKLDRCHFGVSEFYQLNRMNGCNLIRSGLVGERGYDGFQWWNYIIRIGCAGSGC